MVPDFADQLSFWYQLLAAVPVLALLGLVMSGRVQAHRAALIVAALAAILAVTAFRSGLGALGIAAGKGLWLGAWILAVVWPATLLYRIAEVSGFTRIGSLFASMFPNRRENLLVLAWVLPALIQGVAGFGTPIAVAAPLVLACGWSRTRAVAYPLVGYQWSVTFGSMGSSFYMASLTAHLSPAGSHAFALVAACLLGADCLAAGALILLMDGGLAALREGWRLLAVGGIGMAATLVGVAAVVPAIASVSAGGVGLIAAMTLAALDRRRRARSATPILVRELAATGDDRDPIAGAPGARPAAGDPAGDAGAGRAQVRDSWEPSAAGHRAAWVLAPFGYLLVVALAVLLVPQSRAWVSVHAAIAPAFPASVTGLGFRSPAVAAYTPLQTLGHPGAFILLACVLGVVTYRWRGLWQPVGTRELLRRWWGSVSSTTVSIVGLACAATILVQAGMISELADGVSRSGALFPVVSPVLGAVGSFLTGSSTSSNALFSALQAEAASLLSAPEPVVLAAQTAGANIGNSVAPVVILVGLASIGSGASMSRVLRRVVVGTVPLLVLMIAITCVLVAVG